MVTATVEACVTVPPVPFTPTVYEPGPAVPELMINVDDAPLLTIDGAKDAVAPDGTPVAVSAVDTAEPAVTAVEIVDMALLPALTVRVLGAADIEKSVKPGGVTTQLFALLLKRNWKV